MKKDVNVRCISIKEKMGYETPSAMTILTGQVTAERTRMMLQAKLERMVRERAELAKDPNASSSYLARYDEIIENIRGTLTGSSAANCRVR